MYISTSLAEVIHVSQDHCWALTCEIAEGEESATKPNHFSGSRCIHNGDAVGCSRAHYCWTNSGAFEVAQDFFEWANESSFWWILNIAISHDGCVCVCAHQPVTRLCRGPIPQQQTSLSLSLLLWVCGLVVCIAYLCVRVRVNECTLVCVCVWLCVCVWALSRPGVEGSRVIQLPPSPVCDPSPLSRRPLKTHRKTEGPSNHTHWNNWKQNLHNSRKWSHHKLWFTPLTFIEAL